MAVEAKEQGKVSSESEKLFALLAEVESLPVSEALAKTSELALSRAWARGDIEFGRLARCITGRPGTPDVSVPQNMQPSVLLFETTVEWTDQKTPKHQRFSKLYEDSQQLPECDKYKKYVQEMFEGEPRWKVVDITKAEAQKLAALQVRLTDKGLGEIE